MYGYDDMGQLISADHSETRPGSPIPDELFHYDVKGNRVSPAHPGSYSYDAANRLLKQGICSFTYDAAGNATSKACVGHMATDKKWEYTWDAWNRLSVVKYYEGVNATQHKFTIAFGYDAFGRKVWRKKTVVGAQKPETEIYFHDGSDAMYTVKDNVVVERFLMGAGIDEPLAVYRLDSSYYFHTDTLGSVAAITDEEGETRNLYAYESFGKHIRLCPSNTCIPNDSTYTAREWDDDLQLYNYRFRWQDPTTGRFTQEDFTFGLPDYKYTDNNPISYIDPSGLRIEYDSNMSAERTEYAKGLVNELKIINPEVEKLDKAENFVVTVNLKEMDSKKDLKYPGYYNKNTHEIAVDASFSSWDKKWFSEKPTLEFKETNASRGIRLTILAHEFHHAYQQFVGNLMNEERCFPAENKVRTKYGIDERTEY